MTRSTSSTPSSGPEAHGVHGWILIVEDDPLVARAAERIFRSQHDDVVVASGSKEALVAVERPGLVGALVDVWLGLDDDGIALAAVIADRCADAEVVPWSGRKDLDDACRARDLGLPYVMKCADHAIERRYARNWADRARATTWLHVERERRVMALRWNHALTDVQTECVRLALCGWSYVIIAKFRGVSPQAIDEVSQRLSDKTGRTLAELALQIDAEILALRDTARDGTEVDGVPTRKRRRKL